MLIIKLVLLIRFLDKLDKSILWDSVKICLPVYNLLILDKTNIIDHHL